MRRGGRASWRGLAAPAALVLVVAGLALAGCNDVKESSSHYQPATLEPIKGTDVKRVRLDAEGARRIGLRTEPIRRHGSLTVIPSAAVLYDAEGRTFTYTNPEPLVYVRKRIEIESTSGDRTVLSKGPPLQTRVVTVGAAEVYGSEFEVSE